MFGHREERYLSDSGRRVRNAVRPEWNLKECIRVSQAKDSAMYRLTCMTMYINNHTTR